VLTQLVNPSNGSPRWVGALGSLTSHSLATRFFSPEANRVPSGENATLWTKFVPGPTLAVPSRSAGPAAGVDQSRIVPSELPVARTFPSGR